MNIHELPLSEFAASTLNARTTRLLCTMPNIQILVLAGAGCISERRERRCRATQAAAADGADAQSGQVAQQSRLKSAVTSVDFSIKSSVVCPCNADAPAHYPNSSKLNQQYPVVCDLSDQSFLQNGHGGGCTGYLRAKVASAHSLLQERRPASESPTLSLILSRDLFAVHSSTDAADCICSPHPVSAANRCRSTASLSFHFQGLFRLHLKAHILQTGLARATPRPARWSVHLPTYLARCRQPRENRPSNSATPQPIPRVIPSRWPPQAISHGSLRHGNEASL
jgi:hypothetical protein